MSDREFLLKRLTEWAEHWSKPRPGIDDAEDKVWHSAAAEVLILLEAEIPGHPVQDWQREVLNSLTQLGYRDWARHREGSATPSSSTRSVPVPSESDFPLMVYQNLHDWKPEKRVNYGLDALYEEADRILSARQSTESRLRKR